uniref:Uncharacterized protein n=1 Tax=Cacopsylla melanoneura TaxID=428564 RepID=A0A8D8YNU3_9HEMI
MLSSLHISSQVIVVVDNQLGSQLSRRVSGRSTNTRICMQFLPFATETMGTWCEKAIGMNTGGGEETGYEKWQHFTQNISLTVQRGNAASILSISRNISIFI